MLYILMQVVTVSHFTSGSLTSQSDTVAEFTINPKWKDVIEWSLRMFKGGQTDAVWSFSREGRFMPLTLCRLVYFQRKKMCLIILSLKKK